MFFLLAAWFLHTGGVTLANMLLDLLFAFVWNVIGASVFVAGAYWYLYVRPTPVAPPGH